MDGAPQDVGRKQYKSPWWVQRWFLTRSRERWKNKYRTLREEQTRLRNRVADVSKSREKWRSDAEEAARRLKTLEQEKQALQEQLAALKKDGPGSAR